MIKFSENLFYASNASNISVLADEDSEFINMDPFLTYFRFNEDFGPLNIAQIIKFNKYMKTRITNKRLILFSQAHPHKKTNALLLLSFYLLIELKKKPHDIYALLDDRMLVPFRDAGNGPSTYVISILDCLKGFERAMFYKLVNPSNFKLDEYEYYEQVDNGDFNWITPKFIAFASPSDRDHYRRFSANHFAEYFKENKVETVIRLNHKLYDKAVFESAGIEHIEMYYPDGSCPPEYILNQFLDLADQRSVMAIHCKAGLGRTGTLIGAYLMKTYRFTASEVIGYLRLMRPGSVVGPQQNYLHAIQNDLWALSNKQDTLGHDIELPEPEIVDFTSIPGQPRKVSHNNVETIIRSDVTL
eukprot:NODE_814_length_3736_cov_0.382458.p2 type:complete len:358 gc:universal NODE_814_length_3736_cov_0.382458:1957-884(-)